MGEKNRINEKLRPLVRPIEGLAPDPLNAKKHNDRSLKEIATSMDLYGQQTPIVVRPDGTTIKGAGTLLAARALGWTEIAVSTWDGDADRAAAYGVADNRSGEFSTWDADYLQLALTAADRAGIMPVQLGFQDNELAKVMRQLDAGTKIREDDPPRRPSVAVTKLGDVWTLGEHRLICGDSTDAAIVECVLQGRRAELTVTDPPWNIDYVGGGGMDTSRKKRGPSGRLIGEHPPIANDALGAAFEEFLKKVIAGIYAASRPGAAAYVFMFAGDTSFAGAMRAAGFHWSSTVLWVKDTPTLCRRDYHVRYEAAWYGWRGDAARLHPVPDRTQTDVWEYPRPRKSDEHPTMKPVELIARAIGNSSKRGDLVFEPFAGSGTTLVAAEQLARRCAAVELDPGYCDVVVERWEKLTGAKARRET